MSVRPVDYFGKPDLRPYVSLTDEEIPEVVESYSIPMFRVAIPHTFFVLRLFNEDYWWMVSDPWLKFGSLTHQS